MIYGPRPRCKRNRQRDEAVCANLSGSNLGAVAPSHHGYPPTSVLNNSPASRRAMESNQASEVSVEPFLHSSFPSRKPRRVIVPSDPILDLPFRPCFSCGTAQEVGAVVTALCEHAPGHAREFCGQGNNQDIGVEPLGRCLQPGREAMPRPTLTRCRSTALAP